MANLLLFCGGDPGEVKNSPQKKLEKYTVSFLFFSSKENELESCLPLGNVNTFGKSIQTFSTRNSIAKGKTPCLISHF